MMIGSTIGIGKTEVNASKFIGKKRTKTLNAFHGHCAAVITCGT